PSVPVTVATPSDWVREAPVQGQADRAAQRPCPNGTDGRRGGTRAPRGTLPRRRPPERTPPPPAARLRTPPPPAPVRAFSCACASPNGPRAGQKADGTPGDGGRSTAV